MVAAGRAISSKSGLESALAVLVVYQRPWSQVHAGELLESTLGSPRQPDAPRRRGLEPFLSMTILRKGLVTRRSDPPASIISTTTRMAARAPHTCEVTRLHRV